MWFVLAGLLLAVCVLAAARIPDRQSVPTVTAYVQSWCGACQRFKPELMRLAEIGPPDIKVKVVDCGSNEDECAAVTKYPTVLCNHFEYTGQRKAELIKAWALSTSV